MKILVLVILLIIVVVAALIALKLVKKDLKHVRLSSPTNTPVQQPDNHKVKLLQYTPYINDTTDGFAIFQQDNHFFLVRRKDPISFINLRDIYPSFKGKPIGIVLVNGTQYIGKDGQSYSFIVFSSDGKVYNPWTISHPWRKDFMYLPNENPISVDGRPVSGIGAHGLFNNGAPEAGVLFRFYYPGYYIEEQECVAGAAPDSGNTNIPQACHNTKVLFPMPSAQTTSYYHIGNDMYAVSRDGWIYHLVGETWTPYIAWISNKNNGGSSAGLFPVLTFPKSVPLTPSQKTDPLLMGADYDHGVPIFLIYENKSYYMVDRDARKYDFRAAFKNQGVFPAGNIVDITKCGPGEYDFILLATDGNLYGPTLPGQIKSISDFTSIYPPSSGSVVSSITSSYKWVPTSHASGYYNYTLIFLYNDGRWFEVQYNIAKNIIGGLGQTDQISGKWNSWPHVVSALKSLPCSSCFKVSSFGWSIFISDSTNPKNNLVYSINNPVESWVKMLYCSPNADESGYETSTCVGLGSWKDNVLGVTGANDESAVIYQGWLAYQDYGTRTDVNPGIITRKVSLSQCLNANQGSAAVVYDQNESDCHVYPSLTQADSYKDPTKITFIRPVDDPFYLNRFCVKHSSGKYMYWDFTDPSSQKLAMNDVCLYTDIPDLQNASTGDLINLTKSMGAFWTSTGDCLANLNGAVTGSYLNTDASLGMTCQGGMAYINGTFTDGTNCLKWDGTSFAYGTCDANAQWAIEDIPCPPFTSTGYIFDYCSGGQP
jgi:hypothetical protein